MYSEREKEVDKCVCGWSGVGVCGQERKRTGKEFNFLFFIFWVLSIAMRFLCVCNPLMTF